MREIYCFDINPIPAARPRVSRWSTYYPKKYTQFKKDMEALTSELDVIPIENLIGVDLVFDVGLPKSWSKKKKKEKVNTYCDNNVDLDNYQKAILDSLNGILYLDDRQVVEIWAVKQWAEIPKITVGIIDKGE